MDAMRVLVRRLVRVEGLGAVRKVAASTLPPSSPAPEAGRVWKVKLRLRLRTVEWAVATVIDDRLV